MSDPIYEIFKALRDNPPGSGKSVIVPFDMGELCAAARDVRSQVETKMKRHAAISGSTSEDLDKVNRIRNSIPEELPPIEHEK